MAAVQQKFFSDEAAATIHEAFKTKAAKVGYTEGIRCSLIQADTLEEVWFTQLEGAGGILAKIVVAKARSFKETPKSLSPDPGCCNLCCCYMCPFMCCCSGTMAVQGSVDCPIEGDMSGTKYILVCAGATNPYDDLEIAQHIAKVVGVAKLPIIKGGRKKFTDVPLLEQPSSEAFKLQVDELKKQIATGDMDSLKKILNFALFIFGMRHPVELRGLLDNIEAVNRAKAGAEDGSLDPDEELPNEKKFEGYKAKVTAGDMQAMHNVAVAGISLISIFHINKLPDLFPINRGLDQSAGDEITDIKTVCTWALTCFAAYHPDVVVMMKLVDGPM